MNDEEFRLEFSKSFHFYEMPEKFSAFDKIHEEVDSKFVLKHKFHAHNKRMIDLPCKSV